MALPPDPPQGDIASQLQRAVGLHQRGQLADVERAYGDILRQAPANFDVLQLLGTLRIQQARFAEAVDLISAALKINPRSARAAQIEAECLSIE